MNNKYFLIPIVALLGFAVGFGGVWLFKNIINGSSDLSFGGGGGGTSGPVITHTEPPAPVVVEEVEIVVDTMVYEEPVEEVKEKPDARPYPKAGKSEVVPGKKITTTPVSVANEAPKVDRYEGPNVNSESRTYDLTVFLIEAQQSYMNSSIQSPYLFELYKINAQTPSYTSHDGIFRNVKPSTSSERYAGRYTLVVTNIQTGEQKETIISGFKPIYKQLTLKELTDNFNNGGPRDKIHEVSNVKITLVNCLENAPTTLFDIYTRLAANWQCVEVTRVEYNDRNAITAITIKVTM